MEYFTIVLGLFLAFALFQCFILLTRKNKKLPPGPMPLPIIGNLHMLIGGKFLDTLHKLAQTYGPIMFLKFGTLPTVVISSPAMSREILQKHDIAFSGKKIPDALHAGDHHRFGVVWLTANSEWRTLRKILTENIFSRRSLEANRHLRVRKVQDLIEYCRKSSETGEAVEVGQATFRTVLNMLSNAIFSRDLADHYSDTAKEVKDAVWNILMESGKPNLVDFFPMLKKFDPQGIRRRMTRHFDDIIKKFDGLIDERLEKRRLEGNTNNDVLDNLLNYVEENPGVLNRNHIKCTCLDLFIAGVDTTASVVEWTIAELLKNPNIMKRVKDELEKVVGKGNTIEESDIARLPYLDCTIKETLRMHPPAPFLFPRTSKEDVEVAGYTIPKESQVLINIRAFGRDPSLWKDPSNFRPERFIESEIDIRGKNFKLTPFGSGRRKCVGLPLGVRMVPLILGSLLNAFEWKLEGGIEPENYDMEEKVGGILQKAQPLRAVPIPL